MPSGSKRVNAESSASDPEHQQKLTRSLQGWPGIQSWHLQELTAHHGPYLYPKDKIRTGQAGHCAVMGHTVSPSLGLVLVTGLPGRNIRPGK